MTKTNYTLWAIKMKVFMQAHEVWDEIEPKNPNNPVGVKKDKMVMEANGKMKCGKRGR